MGLDGDVEPVRHTSERYAVIRLFRRQTRLILPAGYTLTALGSFRGEPAKPSKIPTDWATL